MRDFDSTYSSISDAAAVAKILFQSLDTLDTNANRLAAAAAGTLPAFEQSVDNASAAAIAIAAGGAVGRSQLDLAWLQGSTLSGLFQLKKATTDANLISSIEAAIAIKPINLFENPL